MKKEISAEKREAFLLAEDPDTHPGDIPVLAPYRAFLQYKSNMPDGSSVIGHSFRQMQQAYNAWSVAGMMKGVRAVIGRAGESDFMLDVYGKEEVLQDPEKEDVKLFFFPSDDEKANDRPFVLAISGGAYTSVCNLPEAFPTAASMNEAGYNVFALNYRVNESNEERITAPLMPKPLEDTAAGLRYIFSHMEELGLRNREYYVTGFSAGANLTVQWGVLSHGYAAYSLPKPRALFPVYPPVDNRIMRDDRRDGFSLIMFGPGFTQETVREYAVPDVMTAEYPPCYIVHALDDDTVPIENTYRMRDRMRQLGIRVETEIPDSGGHGFGDGTGMKVEGWPRRALRFGESL